MIQIFRTDYDNSAAASIRNKCCRVDEDRELQVRTIIIEVDIKKLILIMVYRDNARANKLK